MSDYSSLITTINTLHNSEMVVPTIKTPESGFPSFPFPDMYVGQKEALEQMQGLKSALLSPHTGAGKTAVFTTLTRGEPTIIIEPRKFLQKQVASLFGDFVLYGRKEYKCFHAPHAGIAPCLGKVKCTDTYHIDECDHRVSECIKKPCKVFLVDTPYTEKDFRNDILKYHPDVNKSPDAEEKTRQIIEKHSKGISTHSKFHEYPCDNCMYILAQNEAMRVLNGGGTVVCNFGNFWNLLRSCTTVIVDEADLFFKEVSAPQVLECIDVLGEIHKMLQGEIRKVQEDIKGAGSGSVYKLTNLLYKLQFLFANHELCFAYVKKDRRTNKEKVYVEINPAHTNILKDRLFAGKRVIIVTATPGNFELPIVTYSIWQRCGIYYVPQGKMTSRELNLRPYNLDHAATFIQSMSSLFEGMYGSKKFVVHCGNIGNHATKINTLLDPKQCTLHEAGNLMGTIDKFIASDNKRYLLAASADYGGDFSWCNCQFILKFPYANYDERMKALERSVGKTKFNELYTGDAISRLIQQCGRVGRGAGSFGCTFILDAKFREVYQQYQGVFPDWFKARLHSGTF